MFKSKTSLYFLFPLVVIIWGFVIYRLLDVFEDEPATIPVVQAMGEKELRKVSRDTFSLLPVDHDPFLGHYYKKPEKTKNVKALPVEVVQWPQVRYLGLVSSSKMESGIHVIEINGRQVLLKKGNAVEGVKLLNSGNGKVTLLYEGSRKSFYKS